MLRFSRQTKKGLLGVDISSTSVKILELSVQKNRYCVESYALVPLPEGSVVEKNILNTEAVGECLERAVQRTHLHSHHAAFALPTSSVVTRIIEMDLDMSDDERELQIRMDADQYLPFPVEEASIDFEVLSTHIKNPQRVNVLLVATRMENVEARTEVVELAGLTAKVADVESFALENAFQLFADTLPLGVKTIAILDIGHTMTTLSVMRDNKIIYTRDHVFGGKQLTQEIQTRYGMSYAEAGHAKKTGMLPEGYEEEVLNVFLDTVVQQAARSLQFFFSSSEYNEVDHILLAGGNANIPGLSRLLQQKLGYRVTIANPFIQMQFNPRVDSQKIENDAASLMVACGLALRSFD